MAVIRCPNCGKPNPDFLEVCQYCDAKLRTEGGAPLDTRAPASADDTLVSSGPAAPAAPAAPTPEPEPEAPPSDWMSRLRQMQAGEAPPAARTPADEPDWMWTGALHDDAPPKAASPASVPPPANDSSIELPEWLRDLGEPLDQKPPAPKAAPAAPVTHSQLPVTPAPAAPITNSQLPIPPAPAAPITNSQLPVTPAPAAPITNSQLPVTPPPAEPSPFEPTASDVTIPPRSRRKMTDWLNKLQELPPPTAPAEPEAPLIPNTDADLPDWLKAVAAEAESSSDASPAIEAATPTPTSPRATPTPEEDLPEWLRALRNKAGTPSPAPGTGALQSRPPAGPGNLAERRNQALPEGMRPPAADDTLIPRPGVKPLEAASDDMPDWLKGILSNQAGTPAATDSPATAGEHPVALTGPAADAARKPGGSRPISGAPAPRETPAPSTPSAPSAAAATPRPLSITGQAMPPSAPAAFTPASPAAPPPAAPPAPATPSINETQPPPSRPAKRLSDWLGRTPAAAADAAPVEELPDWLKSLSAESAAKDTLAQPASAAAPAEPLPDWLKTTPPASATAAPEPAAPAASVTNPQLPITPEPAAPAAPNQTLGVSETPRVSTGTPEPAATPAADLPDWLKAMAPASPAAAPEPVSPAASITNSQLPIKPAPEPIAPAASITNSQLPITPAPEPAAALPADDLPEWLKNLASAAPAAPTTSIPASPAAAQAPATSFTVPSTPADDLPDWLKAITQDAATGSALPDTTLTTSASDVGPAPVVGPSAAAAEDLPEWLKAITQPPAATAAEPPATMPLPTLPPPSALSRPAPAASAAADDLPDWLKAITQAESAETPAAASASAAAPVSQAPEPPATAPLPEANEDLPDWLKAITQASDAAATAASAASAASAATDAAPMADDTSAAAAPLAPFVADAGTTLVPGQAAASTTEPPAAAATTPAAGSDQPGQPDQPGVTLPPWLVGVGTAPLPDVQELPDLDEETLAWLSESKKAESTPEPAGLDLANTKLPAEKPEWLDALAAVTATPAATTPPEIAPTPDEDMPEWLRTMRGQSGQTDTANSESTPDWLRAMRAAPAGAAATAAATTAASAAPSGSAIIAATTPAATTAAATMPPAATTPATAGAPAADTLQQGALPAWLAAMRPVDIEQPVPTEADTYEETLGVLAGMRGVLRAEPVVAQPHKAAAALQSLVVSDANTAQVKLLTDLLQTDTAAQPARRGRARLGAHAERWVIFALLLIALVLAQFQAQLGLPAIFAAPAPILPPAAAAVYTLIGSLPASKPALMAFDYDAAQSGELDPGAQAVIEQLAHQGVPVVAVSLNLTGPALAQQVFSQAASSGHANLTPGTSFVNLGYIAGGPVGLLQFAADPRSAFTTDFNGQAQVWAQPALAHVSSLSDFGLIVLVSGTPESTRAWIEQAQSFAVRVPTVAVISAGAEPMVQPYYDDPNANSLLAGHLPLKGLIVGLSGAAAYEQATSAPGAASALWPAMGGGLLAAALIILLGNLIFGVLGGLRRRRA